MTTDKLIAEYLFKLYRDDKIKCISISAGQMADEIMELLRNHQPEPTQKQVDEGIMIELLLPFMHMGRKGSRNVAKHCLAEIRPYLRQVDNVGGEPQLVSGDGIERCIQVCRDLSREYSGNPDDKTLDEIIVDAKEAIAALQTPQPATVEPKGEMVAQQGKES